MNSFVLNFFALFELYWPYVIANLICKQIVTCEHTQILSALYIISPMYRIETL